jgi:hypothetical protein
LARNKNWNVIDIEFVNGNLHSLSFITQPFTKDFIYGKHKIENLMHPSFCFSLSFNYNEIKNIQMQYWCEKRRTAFQILYPHVNSIGDVCKGNVDFSEIKFKGEIHKVINEFVNMFFNAALSEYSSSPGNEYEIHNSKQFYYYNHKNELIRCTTKKR